MNTPRISYIVGAGIILLVITLFAGYISFFNTVVSLENATTAQYRNNQNTYDAFWKSVQETAQVPAQYKEDFKSILVAETSAKFGPGGSQATMQWFQERNLQLPEGMYLKLMNVIEAGRADFKRGQSELLDKQRRLHTHLETFWGSMFANRSSQPKTLSGELAPPKDLDGDGRLTVFDYPIVTSAKTTEAFRSGQDDAITIFPKSP